MKPPSRKGIIEWVLNAWPQLCKENIINSFKCRGLNFASDGTKNNFIHCLKKKVLQSGKAKTKLSVINFS